MLVIMVKYHIICLYEKLIFSIVGRKIIFSFTEPVIQNSEIWFQTYQKDLFKSIKLIISILLKVVLE